MLASAHDRSGCGFVRGDITLLLAQALAALHFIRGELKDAARVTTALRGNSPSRAIASWMRPWMLSLLLADVTGDAAMRADLVAGLGDFVQQAPLSAASPGRTRPMAWRFPERLATADFRRLSVPAF